MITQEEIDNWKESNEYYQPSYEEKARLHCMTPLDMVREFVTKTEQDPKPYLYAALIQEEFEEWLSAHVQNNRENELKELADLAYVVYGYANAKGWNLDEAIRRVHHNNVGRCIQPDGTVQRREDGKILKNKDYPAVDLTDLVGDT